MVKRHSANSMKIPEGRREMFRAGPNDERHKERSEKRDRGTKERATRGNEKHKGAGMEGKRKQAPLPPKPGQPQNQKTKSPDVQQGPDTEMRDLSPPPKSGHRKERDRKRQKRSGERGEKVRRPPSRVRRQWGQQWKHPPMVQNRSRKRGMDNGGQETANPQKHEKKKKQTTEETIRNRNIIIERPKGTNFLCSFLIYSTFPVSRFIFYFMLCCILLVG